VDQALEIVTVITGFLEVDRVQIVEALKHVAIACFGKAIACGVDLQTLVKSGDHLWDVEM
jgi:hypothetical protein